MTYNIGLVLRDSKVTAKHSLVGIVTSLLTLFVGVVVLDAARFNMKALPLVLLFCLITSLFPVLTFILSILIVTLVYRFDMIDVVLGALGVTVVLVNGISSVGPWVKSIGFRIILAGLALSALYRIGDL